MKATRKTIRRCAAIKPASKPKITRQSAARAKNPNSAPLFLSPPIKVTSEALERPRYEAPSALQLYMREMGEVALLTPAEEIALAKRIHRGDEAAREHMIRANLRLVVKIAREYETCGLPLLDLINEGNVGLMKAVERFDPSKGAKLSTYGAFWIKQAIRRALANQSKIIRLPVHVVDKLFHASRAAAEFQQVHGREATDIELAAELGTSAHRIAELRTSSIRPSSLDAPMGDDESSRFADVIADESAPMPWEDIDTGTTHELLRQLIARLPEREAAILKSRFGLGEIKELTLEEIGRKFGVTRERIRQLQNEALKKLRIMIDARQATSVAA